MEKEDIKTLTIRMDTAFYKRLKIATVERDTTMAAYIRDLIEKDLAKAEKKHKK